MISYYKKRRDHNIIKKKIGFNQSDISLNKTKCVTIIKSAGGIDGVCYLRANV